MRVVHIGHAPLVPGHPDHGRLVLHPGRWALNLAIAQRKTCGIDTAFVTQVPGATRDHDTEIEGVPVHYIAAPDRFRAATMFFPDARRISRRVRALAPDLVHAHGTEDAYALAAQVCGRPHVITAQGCYFIINRQFPPRLLSRARAVQLAERAAFRRARDVIAKSAYVRDELLKEFPWLRLHEIPNTVDPALLEIPFDRPRRAGHIAFVGTIVERKGVHVLAEAIEILGKERALEDLTLHVFGDRPGAGAGYEAAVLGRLRAALGDRLALHGTVPAIEVARELSTIPLLVAPSLEEMFGNQLIEALAVGANVLVTEGTALAENARKIGCGRIVPPGDARALAAAMREEVGVTVGPAAREALLRHVGPEVISRRHLLLYEQVLRG